MPTIFALSPSPQYSLVAPRQAIRTLTDRDWYPAAGPIIVLNINMDV